MINFVEVHCKSSTVGWLESRSFQAVDEFSIVPVKGLCVAMGFYTSWLSNVRNSVLLVLCIVTLPSSRYSRTKKNTGRYCSQKSTTRYTYFLTDW